jgi:hypothetical protein
MTTYRYFSSVCVPQSPIPIAHILILIHPYMHIGKEATLMNGSREKVVGKVDGRGLRRWNQRCWIHS